MVAENVKKNILWVKGLLNGIWALLLGFMLYMIPALVVGFKMGFELGPKSTDPGAVSEQISQTIRAMYQNSMALTIGFFVITALMIFWWARKVTVRSGSKTVVNGLLVAVFPVLLCLLFDMSTGFGLTTVLAIVLYVGAGYAGGYQRQ